jgi:hypothetical protein
MEIDTDSIDPVSDRSKSFVATSSNGDHLDLSNRWTHRYEEKFCRAQWKASEAAQAAIKHATTGNLNARKAHAVHHRAPRDARVWGGVGCAVEVEVKDLARKFVRFGYV